MLTKRDVLQRLKRDELVHLLDRLNLSVQDRRVKSQLIDTLASASDVRFSEVLNRLSRDRLKQLCLALSLNECGRTKMVLIQRVTEVMWTPEGLLDHLLAVPLDERIAVVARDVESRIDMFRQIDAFDLANALEVPEPEHPGSAGGEWSFYSHVERQTVEEFAERNCPSSDSLTVLEGKIPDKRFDALYSKFEELDDVPDAKYDCLTAKEREIFEDAIVEELDSQGAAEVTALFSVHKGSDDSLLFNAVIEDDGDCYSLQTPYDLRDEREKKSRDTVEIETW